MLPCNLTLLMSRTKIGQSVPLPPDDILFSPAHKDVEGCLGVRLCGVRDGERLCSFATRCQKHAHKQAISREWRAAGGKSTLYNQACNMVSKVEIEPD
jgi:hypothetical protein